MCVSTFESSIEHVVYVCTFESSIEHVVECTMLHGFVTVSAWSNVVLRHATHCATLVISMALAGRLCLCWLFFCGRVFSPRRCLEASAAAWRDCQLLVAGMPLQM